MTYRKGLSIFILLGLVQGVILDRLVHVQSTILVYYAGSILFTLLYALSYNEKNSGRLVISTLLVTLFLCFPILPLRFEELDKTNALHLLNFLFAFPVFAYIAHSFHYAYHQDNTWKVSYSSLFAAVWNTIPLLFVASVFSSLANALILLAASIFKTVNSTLLWNLYFENIHFRLISNVALFFIGLGVGQQNKTIIYNLRLLLLRIMYYLFPFLALITSVYFILYLVHSFSQQAEYIEPLMILMPLTILGVLFFNSYFQDGKLDLDYPHWLTNCLKIYRVILFLLTIIMVFKTVYLFSVEINSFVYLVSVLLLTFYYAMTSFMTADLERKWIKIGNVSTALFFLLALFLLNIPYFPLEYTFGKVQSLPFLG